MFSEVAEIALVAAQLGQFQQLPKTRVILILILLGPMRLPIQNGQRAKNGSESHFFLHIQIDCSGISSAHMSNVFLQCQPYRLFQCNTSEYS